MEKVTIDDVPVVNNPLGVHSVRKPVSRDLGTTDFAMNYFELEPGDSFSGGLHAHHDQEEVFYIEEGTATFEVGREREEHEVAAGEVIRFSPGEFQMGKNTSDERVVGFALGAPKARHDFEEMESLVHCRECDAETVHDLDLTEQGAFAFACTECGNEFTIG
ncbi:cupin domain-containing protein [Halococcus sediminicola]|uniref:cupin domain-containing protein n=1 Tax=Halococcus sediminicola TaxID=1264579 RepID=UPI0006791D8C|nr:cupin domain-containing protein [Halococcus sediminicola]